MSLIIDTNNISPTLSEIKAHPSVYSPNQGNFNSEENLKWLANKLATKPFVIGKTTKDTRESLKPTLKGNDISIADGMFSIDGYTFRLAQPSTETDTISFDGSLDTENENVIVNVYLGAKTIDDITTNTSGGTTYSINADFDTICFSDYKPSEHTGSQTDWEQMQDDWAKAIKDGLTLGYVKLRYTGTIANVLQVANGKVSYKDNSIIKIDSTISGVDTKSLIETDGLADPDKIKLFINSQLYNIWDLTINDSFAIVESASIIDIYYPIYGKLHRQSDKTNKYPIIYFKDIFGIDFLQSESYETEDEIISDTSSPLPEMMTTNYYPNTNSYYTDMDSNAPLSALTFSSCDITTYPSKMYAFASLYDLNQTPIVRKNYPVTPDPTFFPGTNFPALENIKVSSASGAASVFVKKTISDLVNLIPSTDTDYDKFENTVSYYCLNLPNERLLTVPGDPSSYIPVVFMCSNGTLCPNGIITDGTGTSVNSLYPLEGYTHFLKRRFLELTSTYTEEALQNLTFNDITNSANKSTFSDIYNEFIAKPLSIYFSLCYSSLMENAVFRTTNSITDNIKSSGCGIALSGVNSANLTSYDDKVVQSYAYNGYQKRSTTPISMSADISYYKNTTSDKDIIQKAELLDSGNEYIYGTLRYYKSMPAEVKTILTSITHSATEKAKAATMFDDPVNYLQKSQAFSSSGKTTLESLTLYTILSSGSSWYMYDSGKFTFNTVLLNEDALPITPDIDITSTGGSYAKPFATKYDLIAMFKTFDDSPVNSLRYYFNTSSWYGSVWETVNIKRDALNYLCGRKITANDSDPANEYDGIHFHQKIRSDFEQDDLGIYNVKVASNQSTLGTGQEVNNKYILYSEDADVVRSAYIHIDKVYGDDDKSLKEILRDLADNFDLDLSDLIARIVALETNVGIIYGMIGDTETEGTILYNINQNKENIDKNKTQIDIIKTKLNPYIVDIFNIGENVEDPFNGQPTDIVIAEVYNNGEVIVKGDGATFDFTVQNPSPLTQYNYLDNKYYPSRVVPETENPPIEPIKYIKVLSGVTYLGDRLFSSIDNLVSVDIPESVTQIGSSVFSGTVELGGLNYYTNSTITAPKHIEIGGYKDYKDIVFKSKSTGYASAPFMSCNLDNYYVPEKYVLGIDIPYSANSYNNNAYTFDDNYNLKKIIIDTKCIPHYFLKNCYSLRNVILTQNVKYLSPKAFYDTGITQLNYTSSLFDFLNIDQFMIDAGTGTEYDDWAKIWYNASALPKFISKNHLDIKATSTDDTETNGLRFAVCNDGTVHVHGTATQDVSFELTDNPSTQTLQLPPDKEYTLSGCPSGGSALAYNLSVTTDNGTYYDYGYAVKFEPVASTEDSKVSKPVTVKINVKSGQTLDDVVFYPMLSRTAEYKYSPEFEKHFERDTEGYITLLKINCTDCDIYLNYTENSSPNISDIRIKLDKIPEHYLSTNVLPKGYDRDLSLVHLITTSGYNDFTVTFSKNVLQLGDRMFFNRKDVNTIYYEGTAKEFKRIKKYHDNGFDVVPMWDWAAKQYTIIESDEEVTKYVISGYYNSTDGKFYSDSAYTTEISGTDGYVYINLDDTNVNNMGGLYKYNSSASQFQPYSHSVTSKGLSTVVKVICTGDVENSVFVYNTDTYCNTESPTALTYGQFKLINYNGVPGSYHWDDTEEDFVPDT